MTETKNINLSTFCIVIRTKHEARAGKKKKNSNLAVLTDFKLTNCKRDNIEIKFYLIYD